MGTWLDHHFAFSTTHGLGGEKDLKTQTCLLLLYGTTKIDKTDKNISIEQEWAQNIDLSDFFYRVRFGWFPKMLFSALIGLWLSWFPNEVC